MPPPLPGKHDKVMWYKKMWKGNDAAATWRIQFVHLNAITICFHLPG